MPNLAKARAEQISEDKRKQHFNNFKETQLHEPLKIVLSEMVKNASVYVTHGSAELGKDITIVATSQLGDEECSAVVVKCGKISGATTSDIDEIKSQVDMCFETKAKLPSTTQEYDVKKVIIAIFGTLSTNARTRLEAQILNKYKPHIMLWDIDKLTKLFTEYYPEFFIGGQAVKWLAEKIEELKNNDAHIGDSRYFLTPRLQKEDTHVEDYIAKKRSEKKNASNLSLLKKNFFGNSVNYTEFLDLVIKADKTVMYGDAGSGKSYVLKKIAIDMMQKAINNCINDGASRIQIPVYVKALELTNGTVKTAKELIESYEGELGIDVSVVLLDGIDEVSKTIAEQIVNDFEIHCAYKKIKLLVSSRKTNAHLTLKGFKEYSLLPLSERQIIDFVKNLNKEAKFLASLKDELSNLKTQIQLYPLSFWLLLDLAEQNREVPATITEIYTQYIDMALGSRDHSKGINVLFGYKIKKYFLSKLAYEKFFLGNSVKLSRSEFCSFTDEYIRNHKGEIGDKENFINELDRSGILKIDEYFVSFGHKSFLDYFIANYLSNDSVENKSEILIKNFFGWQWEDVVYFYFGIKTTIDQRTIDAIMSYTNHSDESVSIDKFFIGKLLQYAWHTDSDIKQNAIKAGLSFSDDIILEAKKLLKEQMPQLRIPKIFDTAALYKFFDFCYRSASLYEDMKSMYFNNASNLIEQNTSENSSAESELDLLVSSMFVLSYRRLLSQEEIADYITQIAKNADKIKNKQLSISLVGLFSVCVSKGIIDKAPQVKEIEEILEKSLKKLSKKYESIYLEAFSAQTPDDIRKKQLAEHQN